MKRCPRCKKNRVSLGRNLCDSCHRYETHSEGIEKQWEKVARSKRPRAGEEMEATENMSHGVRNWSVQQILLSMRAGTLYKLSRDERRALLEERVVDENVDGLLDESYLPIEDWAKIPHSDIQALQETLRREGRNLGRELVWKNHQSLDRVLGTDHDRPLETKSEQMSRTAHLEPFYDERMAVNSYISDRLSYLERKRSFSIWHIFNTLLFLFAIYLGDAVFEDGSQLFFVAWMLSGIWAVSTSAREGKRINDLRQHAYSELAFVLEKPLEQGISEVFETERSRRSFTKPPSRHYQPPQDD